MSDTRAKDKKTPSGKKYDHKYIDLRHGAWVRVYVLNNDKEEVVQMEAGKNGHLHEVA